MRMSISSKKENLKHHVEEICSHSPRYAGTEGEAKTRDYIVSEGKKLGISVELEEFEYLHHWPISSELTVLSPVESILDNYPLCYAGSGVAEGDAIYAGSGTQEEFELFIKQGIDINGKIVLISTSFAYRFYSMAQHYGASGVVVLTDAPGNLCRASTATANREPGEIPAVLVPAHVGQRLLTLISCGQLRLRVALKGEFSKKVSSNIVMTIPGTTISNEQVILPAHYDSHNIGKGAWDNASGCAAVLELVRIFSERKPNRTIKALFCGVEEIGLFWGSFSYVNKHSSEIRDIKALVVFDGAGAPYDLHNFNWELFTTKEIRTLALKTLETLGYQANKDFLFNHADPPPGSDHVHFQARGVPIVWPTFRRMGIFYHTEKDDPETLDYDRVKAWSDFEGEIAYSVATQEQLPY